MRLRQIGISLLLMLASAHVVAEAGGYRGHRLNAVRTYQMQGFALDRSEQRRPQPAEREDDRRRDRGYAVPDSSGHGAQGDSSAQADNARKQGRLSPEERRALRRQIDEAGQDIYSPRR